MTYIFYDVNRGVTKNQYFKYHIYPLNSLQNIRQNRWSMKIRNNDPDLITLNCDAINISDAHPSLLRSCLYKQTAIYYFIEAS